MSDLFETGLRDRVLRAWTESPARFRADANAEEDYALGGYRDQVVVELAQNAADAARRQGKPGRLRLTLRDGVLTAANTGAPIDANGIESLSTLRASAKRDEPGTVGRFGVGFAATVSVSDEPMIVSAGSGGAYWSAARTRELVAGIPELAEELGRRDGHVPVLRLPFPVDPAPADVAGLLAAGFDTVVRLPLRDPAAEERVRRGLDEAGPVLLLALPSLETIEIEVSGEVRTLTAVYDGPGQVTIDGLSWRTVEAHGPLDPGLLADRPAEERARPYWRLRWALPAGRGMPADVPAVLHAPTPSAEPLGLPALLIASFPMATDRRHAEAGPLTDFLVERAADAYSELLLSLPETPGLLDLVPGPLAEGALDARVRAAVLARVPELALLPGPGVRIRGRDAVAVDGPGALLDLLGEVLPGLLPVGWPVRHPGLAALEVRRLELADLVDALASLEREPDWWQRLYQALSGLTSEGLGALPVPLADGRMVRGPRGLLIAADGVEPAGLGALALRFVDPSAVHPLLLRLGAVEAGPRAVLTDPAVRSAVAGSFDADDPDAIAEAVLGLVAAARLDAGDEPWLAELALPGADGSAYPAGELLLPDSPLRAVMAEDAPFEVVDADLVDRHGAAPLEAVGVLRGFALVREEDVSLGDLALDLDGEEDWADDVLDRLPPQDVPPLLPEFTAVRDLELVDDWAAALPLLAGLRSAVTEPAHVLLGDGRRVAVPSYTAWWLGGHPVLDGRRPDELRFPDAVELAGLYDLVPSSIDPLLAAALGVRTSLDALLDTPGGVAELLDRLADPGRPVGRAQLRSLWAALAVWEGELSPPGFVRALVDGVPEVVAAADAIVVDRPDTLALLAGQPLVLAPWEYATALAQLLDLSLAGDEVPGEVGSSGAERDVPAAALELLPEAPVTYVAHEELVVDGQRVSWWYEPAGDVVHAGDLAGLARGLAWAAERWPDRLLAEAVLRDPAALPGLLAERDLEPFS